MTSRLCVLLPAYNEGEHIGPLVKAIREIRLEGVSITPLVVNDGSRDNTARVAAEAGAVVISHEKNRGVGAAFRTGVEWARREGFDYLLHMDSDGQVPAAEIPLLVEPVSSGRADLALGTRFQGKWPSHFPRWKALALATAARLVGFLTGTPLTDISCGFRCMNRKILDVLHPHFDYDYIQESLIQALGARARVVDVPVTIDYSTDAGIKGMSRNTFRYSRRYLLITATSLFNFYRTRLRNLL